MRKRWEMKIKMEIVDIEAPAEWSGPAWVRRGSVKLWASSVSISIGDS